MAGIGGGDVQVGAPQHRRNVSSRSGSTGRLNANAAAADLPPRRIDQPHTPAQTASTADPSNTSRLHLLTVVTSSPIEMAISHST